MWMLFRLWQYQQKVWQTSGFATFSSHLSSMEFVVLTVYIKSGKKITPLLTGGGQERDYRSTTENVAGLLRQLGTTFTAMERLDLFASKTSQMRSSISSAQNIQIFCLFRWGKTLHLYSDLWDKGCSLEVIVHAFEDYDIFILTSACSSKAAGKPAGTLIAMGIEKIKSPAVRLSLDLEEMIWVR